MNRQALTRTLAVAAAGVVAVSASVTSAAAKPTAPQRLSANSVTFQASPSADAAAPNISSVVVSNDDNGLLTFQINISNRPQLTGDMDVALLLDSDQNPATGDPNAQGADYWIDLSNNDVALGSWNGSDFDFSKQSPASLIYSYDSGATIKIKASDVGQGLTGFNFYVVAMSGIAGDANNPDFTNAHADFAPAMGHADWSYQVKITPLQLTVVKFSTVPARPKAGQAYAAAMVVGASIPAGLAQGAQVSCTATISGKPIKTLAAGFAGQTARCAWQLPRSAKGKTISGSVTVTYQSLQVSRSFSARIG